jgi:hypothetical protein
LLLGILLIVPPAGEEADTESGEQAGGARVAREGADRTESPEQSRPTEEREPETGATAAEAERRAEEHQDEQDRQPAVQRIPAVEAGREARLAIVIDDVGYNMEQLRPFLELTHPITIAVLPRLPYSERAAKASTASGKEVILHQPMEPRTEDDPGPGVIRAGLDRSDLIAQVERNLSSVPGAVGVNNHMGSRATADPQVMGTLLQYLDERGLLFLDSRTTTETVSARLASLQGYAVLERDVFLDNEATVQYMEEALLRGLEEARREGEAVLIGHVSSGKLPSVLTRLIPEAQEKGYRVVSLASLLESADARVTQSDTEETDRSQ